MQAATQTPRPRTAILVSSDLSFRERLRTTLTGLRWQVREAAGGAEALAHLDAQAPEALVLDSWLPDLEISEFVAEFGAQYPGVDLITVDGIDSPSAPARSPRRNELLHALRRSQEMAGAQELPARSEGSIARVAPGGLRSPAAHGLAPFTGTGQGLSSHGPVRNTAAGSRGAVLSMVREAPAADERLRLPEFVGNHPLMLEVSRRIRLVAPRSTSVLIQGPTGSGKELVARALHRLSPRAQKPFVALNCAAIPEALLEAELFGHTRGAFTGAVQGRVGRIEAAHGGTIFLDEIGEMPLPLQAKLLRFLESGELQRVGENEPVRVDVRVIAATHQPLAKRAREGAFRADLFYRLAVFLIHTPQLSAHGEDIPILTDHFLARLCRESAAKSISLAARRKLAEYAWPGNVRELEHVLERAYILAEERPEIALDDIEFGDETLAAMLNPGMLAAADWPTASVLN